MSKIGDKSTMPSWLASEGWKSDVYDILKNLGTGYIPLDIFGLRAIASNDFQNETVVSTGGSEKASGGILASLGAIGSLNRVNGATDKAARVVLKNGTTGEFQFPTVALPPNIDDGEDLTINLLARMAGSSDTTTVIDVQAFFGVGDTECGGNTSALTATIAKKSVTIAAADVLAYPNVLNIMLVPGTHATDAIWIYGAWIEYVIKAV